MKRSREYSEMESIIMAKCLTLLSSGVQNEWTSTDSVASRVFECRTCNRQFSSFQALGGHRASHKKLKSSSMEEDLKSESKSIIEIKPNKSHECSICGIVFTTGQALGGHMRKHRVAINESLPIPSMVSSVVNSEIPVLKRSNSKRVFCLDLNLTPLENDFELLFGKLAPKIDCL